MVSKWFRIGVAIPIFFMAGCAPKPVPAPPPPPPAKQNLFVLLPDPDGKPSGITVSNSAGR